MQICVITSANQRDVLLYYIKICTNIGATVRTYYNTAKTTHWGYIPTATLCENHVIRTIKVAKEQMVYVLFRRENISHTGEKRHVFLMAATPSELYHSNAINDRHLKIVTQTHALGPQPILIANGSVNRKFIIKRAKYSKG